MLADQIAPEQTPETTRSIKFPWEAGVATITLIAYCISGDSHLAHSEPYLLWESELVIVIRFALLAAALVCSCSAIRRGRSPSLFLTVPCLIVCCFSTLYWLDYLIRWIFVYHPNPY